MAEQDHKPTDELIKWASAIADPEERQTVIGKIRELQEVVANAEWVFNAEPVKQLEGSEFSKSEKSLITQVNEFFKSIGGKVEREGFGMVNLTRQGIKSSIAHGIGRVKAAAFTAVPEIIKQGKIIDRQTNWKGRGYDTYVIDAPINIGNIEYIAEVIINKDKDGQRFYLHEVEIKEKARSAFKTGMDTSALQAPAQSAFKTATERGAPQASRLIITRKLREVNKNILEIIDKHKELSMKIPISTQADYDKIVKGGQHIGNEIVIQNTADTITVHTNVTVGKNGRCKTDDKSSAAITAKENGVVIADGKTTVIGYGNANIIAKGNCKITLNDSAFGNCYEHCHITLKGASKISADGNCTVHAYDEAAVSASGSSKVYTYQKATAKGTDVTALSGKDESTLTGQKNCSIMAKDNCIVYASDNCAVQAADNCLVVANKYATIKASDNCLIMSNENPNDNITLFDKCEHLKLENVNDKNIMGALKQMAQSKAVVERPYVAIQILKDNIPQTRREAVNRRLNTMGLKDQTAAKNYLYSLIEAAPVQKNQAPAQNLERQLETARKAGYVQGVCECVAVVGNEQNMGKKLLSEMNVTKDMAKKFANPETFKTLEKGIFAQKVEQKLEQTHSRKL